MELTEFTEFILFILFILSKNLFAVLLSAIMIVKNEESNLPRCLNSLQAVADETVIVDTGSSDGTVEIAKSLGARLFLFPWNGNESDARNVSAREARGRWLWMVDADEEATPELGEELKQVLPKLEEDPSWNSLSMIWENHHPGNITSLLRVLRIGRNRTDYRFSGSIHPVPRYLEKTWPLQGRLKHYGYLWNENLHHRKVAHLRQHLQPLLVGSPPPLDRFCQFLSLLAAPETAGEFREEWKKLEQYPPQMRLEGPQRAWWLENLGNYLRYFALEDDFETGRSFALEAHASDPSHHPAAFYLLQRAVKVQNWSEVSKFSKIFEEWHETQMQNVFPNSPLHTPHSPLLIPHSPLPTPYSLPSHNQVFPESQVPAALGWGWLARHLGKRGQGAGFGREGADDGKQEPGDVEPFPCHLYSIPAGLAGQGLEKILKQSSPGKASRLLSLLSRACLESRIGRTGEMIAALDSLARNWPRLPWLLAALQRCVKEKRAEPGFFYEKVLHIC